MSRRRHGERRCWVHRRPLVVAVPIGAGLVAALIQPASAAGRDHPTVHVNARSSGEHVSRYLAGVNQRFYRRAEVGDSRASGAEGIRLGKTLTSGSLDPRVIDQVKQTGLSLLRYPGGTAGNYFRWKDAIGPRSERGCQINGKRGHRVDSAFGPDEQQSFADAAGAKTQIMVPFLVGTARAAADWVEYMNNPVSGPNINGGVDWAERRAANGHAAPYNITRWEIGNEPFFRPSRGWLPDGSPGTAGYARAMKGYALGGTFAQPRQPVGTACNHRPHRAVVTSTAAYQTYRVYHPPVVGHDQKVWVGGYWSKQQQSCVMPRPRSAWTEVGDLSSADPRARVYTFDDRLGKITFGSGHREKGAWVGHGLTPPMGGCVWASYRSGPHQGFRSYYRAMKQVDAKIPASDIDVCAAWGRLEWPRFAASHDVRYDCLITHPYRILDHRWTSAQQGYAEQMIGRAAVLGKLKALHSALNRWTPKGWRTYLAASEYGVIGGSHDDQPAFGPHDQTWKNSLMRAVYNATQLADFMNIGMAWAEGGMLLTDDSTGVISGPPHYFFSAHARALQAMKPMLTAGGHTLRHRVVGNDVTSTRWGRYPALVTVATKSEGGDLYVMVVNRDPHGGVRARIQPAHFDWKSRIEVWRVSGPRFWSVNNARHPNRVHLQHGLRRVGPKPFDMTFAPHSVTYLKLTRQGR